jgi:hypothetical protein
VRKFFFGSVQNLVKTFSEGLTENTHKVSHLPSVLCLPSVTHCKILFFIGCFLFTKCNTQKKLLTSPNAFLGGLFSPFDVLKFEGSNLFL